MRARVAAGRAACVLAVAIAGAAFTLGTGGRARAQSPEVGGSVRSVLSLSVSQPSGFTRAGGGGAGSGGKRRGRLYTATIQLAVTATEAPTRLSLADGEATGGARHGHLIAGGRVLSPALEASAGRGPYRSLASRVDPQLGQSSEPLAEQPQTIRLRQAYRGGASNLRRYHKLLLVTVTAGGP